MIKFKWMLWVVALIIEASVVQAAKLKSFCLMEENAREPLGQNVEERLPIASVSKVFTTLFVLNKNSVDRKIYTQFYFTPVKKDLYDVHIKGGHEPYFNREAMQWLIAKLNEAGVTRIHNLTFDENFKYYHDTDKRTRIGRKMIDPVAGKLAVEAPEPDLVRLQLMQTTAILKSYGNSIKEASLNGVQLPKKLIFQPAKISFLHSSQFVESAQTKKAYIASPELIHMIKMMNWNSNNHAANQLFSLGGGVEEFNRFFYGKLGLQEKDVFFVNGSGQNADLTGEGRIYNEATCSTVVKTVRALKKNLETQKKTLQDAMAVMGGDIGSTVGGKTYTNDITKLSVIAKTGTVGTNITLAGMISAKSGNHFFFYNVEVNPAPMHAHNKTAWVNAEANKARKIISTKLTELIKQLGGPKPIDYKPQVFDLENFEDEPEERVGPPLAKVTP